jgi:hypothetical protein
MLKAHVSQLHERGLNRYRANDDRSRGDELNLPWRDTPVPAGHSDISAVHAQRCVQVVVAHVLGHREDVAVIDGGQVAGRRLVLESLPSPKVVPQQIGTGRLAL